MFGCQENVGRECEFWVWCLCLVLENGCLIVVLLRFKMHIPFLLATKRSVEGVDCEAIS